MPYQVIEVGFHFVQPNLLVSFLLGITITAMEIQEALQWTDNLIFAKTGKHLDSRQGAILKRALWEYKGYKDIAKEYHYC